MDLYLGIGACSYEIKVTTETRTRGLFNKKTQVRYTARVYVDDTYDFQHKKWSGVSSVLEGIGTALNNATYYLHEYGDVGADYEWTAYYEYSTNWEDKTVG